MTDLELHRSLGGLCPPAPSEVVRDRALHHATLALASARAEAPESVLPQPRSFALGFAAFASVALVLGLVTWLTFRPAPSHDIARQPDAPAAELLAQIQELFNGQLDAVIDRNGSLQLELSALPSLDTPHADQALVLELTRGARRLRILAYSGRPVRLLLDQSEVIFSPFLTGSGKVLLAGETFAWSSATTTPAPFNGWQITARPLAANL